MNWRHQPALDIWAERAGVHTEDLKNTLQKGETGEAQHD